jgi:hypothetical protein
MEKEQPSDVPILNLIQALTKAEEKKESEIQRLEDEVRMARMPFRRAMAAALDKLVSQVNAVAELPFQIDDLVVYHWSGAIPSVTVGPSRLMFRGSVNELPESYIDGQPFHFPGSGAVNELLNKQPDFQGINVYFEIPERYCR